MKTRIIFLLILLLFLSSDPVHSRKADIRVIDSHILLSNDSVHVRLILKAVDLPSDYRMDLTPVIWSGAEKARLRAVRISGSRNRRSQERKALFGGGERTGGVYISCRRVHGYPVLCSLHALRAVDEPRFTEKI